MLISVLRKGFLKVKQLAGFVGRQHPKMLFLMALPLLFAAFISLRTSRQPTVDELPAAMTVNTEQLEITLPERINAGEGFELIVEGVSSDATVEAVVDGAYGLHRFSAVPDTDRLVLTIPAIDVSASGTVLVTAIQGDALTSQTYELVPGDPVDPIDLYLGPRTVIADAAHFIMLVAVPTDRWGNPVVDDTPVDFTVIRPDQLTENQSNETQHLLSWFEVFSQTVAGRTRVAAVSGDAGAPERTFLEVAGVPAQFGLEVLDPLLPADSIGLIRVRTTPLVDEFGNLLPDGTAVYLDTDGVTGVRRIHGQTNGGRAEFTLEVPAQPGPVTLTAIASGTKSVPLTIDFDSAVAEIVGRIETGDETIAVHIGPVRSVRNSYVPDGVVARVTLADGSTAAAELLLGVGTAHFPTDADGSEATIEILGDEIVVKAEK